MGQVSTSTQSQDSRFGHCIKTFPIRSALPSVTPPLAVLLHPAGAALLVPVIDNAFREELNKLAHICFLLSKYKEDATISVLSVTWIVVLACQALFAFFKARFAVLVEPKTRFTTAAQKPV